MRGRVEVQLHRAALGRRGFIEQAKLAFLAQHPGGGAVDEVFGHLAGFDRFGERLAVAAHVGKLHVHAGGQCHRPGVRG